MEKKITTHYIDNKMFLAAMIEWKRQYNISIKKGDKAPPATEYIGECFLKIATHLSNKLNFINYTYLDEMISDGVENCLQYVRNFNPKTSKNPFAYFTQIIYYAFLRRIAKEKKQSHIKNKLIEKAGIEYFTQMPGDDRVYNLHEFDLNMFLPEQDVYKPKKKKINNKGLEVFMDNDEDSSGRRISRGRYGKSKPIKRKQR
tara:strand:+ start:217 stop:819 length:603 start_codon:yes stop_codon:yes gene_type:complete